MKRIGMNMTRAALGALLLVALATSAFAGEDYLITIGDKIAITVMGEKDLSGIAKVKPDGKISLPTVGEVVVSGLTVAQAQERVGAALREYIRNPVVALVVQESSNTKVYVVGGGVKATVADLMENKTLLQLLTGLGDLGGVDMEQATLTRDGKVVLKDFRELFSPAGAERDMPLQPGDSVYLPPSGAKNVYVLGAVATPRALPFQEGMTVLEAILGTGGYSKFASPNTTRVVRWEQGQKKVIKVKGKQLVQEGDLSQNVQLRGGDVVIVDEGFF